MPEGRLWPSLKVKKILKAMDTFVISPYFCLVWLRLQNKSRTCLWSNQTMMTYLCSLTKVQDQRTSTTPSCKIRQKHTNISWGKTRTSPVWKALMITSSTRESQQAKPRSYDRSCRIARLLSSKLLWTFPPGNTIDLWSQLSAYVCVCVSVSEV